MAFTTVSALVSNTKQRIDEIGWIVDTLLLEYRTASELICSDEHDPRKKYLDQLTELNQTLALIVDEHPVINVEKIWRNATNVMTAIASNSQNVSSISNK